MVCFQAMTSFSKPHATQTSIFNCFFIFNNELSFFSPRPHTFSFFLFPPVPSQGVCPCEEIFCHGLLLLGHELHRNSKILVCPPSHPSVKQTILYPVLADILTTRQQAMVSAYSSVGSAASVCIPTNVTGKACAVARTAADLVPVSTAKAVVRTSGRLLSRGAVFTGRCVVGCSVRIVEIVPPLAAAYFLHLT
jgi:hypothetical protein